MSLGWLAEAAILPRKPHQIEEVGKESLVDLKAALYASEEKARNLQNDPAARANEEQRRRERRQADGVGAHNKGVDQRGAADLRAEPACPRVADAEPWGLPAVF